MKKLFLTLLILAWASVGWGATYNIGPGETYETFAALEAGVVLAGDDIVSGGFNVFAETWTPATSGTSGHPIIIRNADIAYASNRGIYLNSKNYFTISNINISLITARGIDAIGSDITIQDVTTSGASGSIGIYVNGDNFSSRDTAHSGSHYYGLQVSPTANIANITIDGIEVNSLRYAIYLLGTSTYSISTVSISDFVLNNPSTTIYQGVLGDYIVGATVQNGTITGYSGIKFDHSSDIVITGITINEAGVTGGHGIQLLNTATASIALSNIKNVYYDGINLDDVSSATITENMVSSCRRDGISLYENVTNSIVTKNIIHDLTLKPDTSANDAFTSHGGCTGNTFSFNFSYNNANTAHAHTGTSNTGYVYHHTSYKDGDSTNSRAVFSFSDEAWVYKNCVIYNTISYPLVQVQTAGNLTADYNAYISNISPTGAPFKIGGVNKTWAEWIAAVGNETHSIYIHEDSGSWKVYYGSDPTTLAATLDYCPLSGNGKLINRSDNPLIDAGVRVSGINDANQTDLAGNKMYGMPDIGAYEVVPRRQTGILHIGR